jgi:hypothetical protein
LLACRQRSAGPPTAQRTKQCVSSSSLAWPSPCSPFPPPRRRMSPTTRRPTTHRATASPTTCTTAGRRTTVQRRPQRHRPPPLRGDRQDDLRQRRQPRPGRALHHPAGHLGADQQQRVGSKQHRTQEGAGLRAGPPFSLVNHVAQRRPARVRAFLFGNAGPLIAPPAWQRRWVLL